MNDKEIILLLRDSPSKGLYEAIAKYSRLIRTVVRRILPNNPEDVEECVEDTFVNVWRHVDNIDLNNPNLKAYLLTTARNITITRYRQLKRRDVVSLECVPEPTEDDVSQTILDAETSRELKSLIMEMQEPDRGIFFRRYFLFETQKQIAQALELSEVQIKNKLYRGRLWLRKELEERGIPYEVRS